MSRTGFSIADTLAEHGPVRGPEIQRWARVLGVSHRHRIYLRRHYHPGSPVKGDGRDAYFHARPLTTEGACLEAADSCAQLFTIAGHAGPFSPLGRTGVRVDGLAATNHFTSIQYEENDGRNVRRHCL